MAYTKKVWTLPNPITDVALNNIENGVADAHTMLDATGTPSTLSAVTANAIGTSTAKARADHTHAIAANVTPAGLSAVTANAVGTSTSLARADHTHAIAANVYPTTQAIGDNAVVGTSAALARADHQHEMPSFGYGDTNVMRGSAITTGMTAWTSIPATTVVEIPVVFPRPMPSIPKVVISQASNSGAIYDYVVHGSVNANSITTTGFTIRARIYPNGVAGYGGFSWIAACAT